MRGSLHKGDDDEGPIYVGKRERERRVCLLDSPLLAFSSVDAASRTLATAPVGIPGVLR